MLKHQLLLNEAVLPSSSAMTPEQNGNDDIVVNFILLLKLS